jgi:hypothetical protein
MAPSLFRRPRVWFVPGLGVCSLAAASYLWRGLPRPSEKIALQAEIENLRIVHDELAAQSTPTTDELCDRLPRTLSIGVMLERIEQAARTSNVRAVSFGSNEVDGQRRKPTEQPDDTLEVTPTEQGESAIRPDVLRCEITVDGDFRALVHFLALLETMPAITRVANLSITPNALGVTATVGVLGFSYAASAPPASIAATPEGR